LLNGIEKERGQEAKIAFFARLVKNPIRGGKNEETPTTEEHKTQRSGIVQIRNGRTITIVKVTAAGGGAPTGTVDFLRNRYPDGKKTMR